MLLRMIIKMIIINLQWLYNPYVGSEFISDTCAVIDWQIYILTSDRGNRFVMEKAIYTPEHSLWGYVLNLFKKVSRKILPLLVISL